MEGEMEIDMVDDLLGDEDGVAVFLKHKLKSIQSTNEHLLTTLAEVDGHIAEIQVSLKNTPIAPWTSRTSWTRFHNGKWCFIVQMEPIGGDVEQTPLHDFQVVLQWRPMITPQCAVKLYTNNEFRKEVNSNESFYIVIVIEAITFISHKQFDAAGVVYCRRKDMDGNMKFSLPPLSLAIEALNSGALNVQHLNLINNVQEDILAALACCMEVKLFVSLPPQSVTQLKEYLIIDCMCRELHLNETTYYLMYGNADHLNGCIFRIPDVLDTFETSLFVRNIEHFYNVLHYLMATIVGLQVTPFPRKLRASLDNDDEIPCSQLEPEVEDVDGDVKKFGECLLRQIDAVIDFQHVVASGELLPESDVTEEYLEMRTKLTELECTSDMLHAKFV